LGEFEQGRPLIEKLKAEGVRLNTEASQLKASSSQPKILLTFFSPSGYEVQKNYSGADWVFYLPIDGPRNARRFLEIVKPSLVIFVKYEFWYYYLKKIKYRNIPLLLVSALFRRDMSFFKWYGGLQRKMLSRFDHLFVQNEASKKLMDDIGLAEICSVSGDTRFDRVSEIADRFEPIPAIGQFAASNRLIVAGSTWKEDEEALQQALPAINDLSLKLIIAPHEITESHLSDLKKLFPDCIRYSELPAPGSGPALPAGRLPAPTTLIIDNIGMLSRLYKYAHITLVGGGFKKMGVHNVLEAAVYGKPVLFGPFYEKYTEAVGLVNSGGGIVVANEEALIHCIRDMVTNPASYEQASNASRNFVEKNKGATERVIQFIQEKRLLTN
jgi:3-deoxy-D-manno-octulosonic-acid transferase